MAEQTPFRVAIVGGGLGGISLGIALQRRHIPFTLYERGRSFTEIGAGLNLGPTAVQTLGLIDPSLGEKVHKLATKSPVPSEDVWMNLRYGAAWDDHEDGELFHKIMAPPTGPSMTLHRQELLALLAEEMGQEHAKFNKKFETYEQGEDHVILKFSDGTEETASVLVGCDGIRSKVRMCMFGEDSPLSKPVFSQSGCYRAVLPMEKALEAIGDSALQTTLLLTPQGYLITYPVSGGTKMNCGAWTVRPGQKWTHPEWTLPNQGEHFKEDFKDWGPRAHRILALYDQDPAFWATFQHERHPDSFVDGLVILIGDGAHSMPPHQGAGAGQALEDAYVLAEALAHVASKKQDVPARQLKASLRAAEQVRAPRFTTVHRFSTEGADRFFGLWEQKLKGQALQEWVAETEKRLKWIWDGDMAADAGRVRDLLDEQLSQK